jgi:hypothetical protein
MAETITSEIYRPLQNDEIRLLQINSPPKLMFSLVTATTHTAPQYVALSYTWGALVFSETIIVNGHDFAVTANLKEA